MEYLLTLNDLSKLDSRINGVIIGNSKFAVRLVKSFDLDIIDSIEKDIYISVNKIFHMSELKELERYLIEVKKKNVKGIFFSDLGVYQICKRLNLTDKLIYDPITLIVNKMELLYFENKIKGIVVSPFISIENLKEFKSDKLELYFLGNGRIPLLYSKRPLLTNYAKYHDMEEDFIFNKLYIKEELRESIFPIIQDENGTHVFSPYIFSSLGFRLDNIDKLIIDLVYDNEFIKGDNEGFLNRKIVYKKERI